MAEKKTTNKETKKETKKAAAPKANTVKVDGRTWDIVQELDGGLLVIRSNGEVAVACKSDVQ